MTNSDLHKRTFKSILNVYFGHGSISADFNPLGFSKSHLASEGRTRVSERDTRGVRERKRGDPSVIPRGIREQIREALESKNPRGDRI